jgi:hypothetical protein
MLWEQCTCTNISTSFPTDCRSVRQFISPAFSLEFVLVLPQLIYIAFVCGKHNSLLPISLNITKNLADSLFYLQCTFTEWLSCQQACCRLHLKCDGTCAETRFGLSAKWTSPFKSAGASVQSTAGSRGVCISGSNAGYTVFRGSARVLATHSIRQFPLYFPSRASPCAITFQLDFTITIGHITPVVGTTDLQQKCGLQNYTTKQLLPCLLFSSTYYCSVLFN